MHVAVATVAARPMDRVDLDYELFGTRSVSVSTAVAHHNNSDRPEGGVGGGGCV